MFRAWLGHSHLHRSWPPIALPIFFNAPLLVHVNAALVRDDMLQARERSVLPIDVAPPCDSLIHILLLAAVVLGGKAATHHQLAIPKHFALIEVPSHGVDQIHSRAALRCPTSTAHFRA
mmetsp:Transcript_26892/g.81411  ORF Transcript_26892/g.81411 Transcript_26892/m.81411 type:complete len:119 (-) Transcript_26892:1174-1530(-)